MPFHRGLLPREGFRADTLFRLIGNTAFNPALLLPLILLARFTKKGEDLSILHPTLFARIKTLFYLGVASWLNRFLSQGVLNNWVDDKYDWSNEIVLITGGSGGIGSHIVQLLAEHGVKVVILDIQEPSFATSPLVHYYKCDITSPATIAATAKEIRAAVGDPTIVINNAGVARGKTILGASERDIRFTFDVNTLATYWVAREFVPALVRADHGMVVTVVSFAAWMTVPDMVDYAASKAAAQAFHDGLTAELRTRYAEGGGPARRVRTVAVHQGYTRTPLFAGYHNEQEFLVPALQPETVAEAVVRQVLSGRSGQVVLPAVGNVLPALGALPHWIQVSFRAKGQNIMTNFAGRQVVKDLDKFYAEREKASESAGTEESAVLVPEA